MIILIISLVLAAVGAIVLAWASKKIGRVGALGGAVAMIFAGTLGVIVCVGSTLASVNFASEARERYDELLTWEYGCEEQMISIAAQKSNYNEKIIAEKKRARKNPFLLDKDAIEELVEFENVFPREGYVPWTD